MTTIRRPSIRAKPVTIASSSPNRRSPWSSMKSSAISSTSSSVRGRRRLRASWTRAQTASRGIGRALRDGRLGGHGPLLAAAEDPVNHGSTPSAPGAGRPARRRRRAGLALGLRGRLVRRPIRQDGSGEGGRGRRRDRRRRRGFRAGAAVAVRRRRRPRLGRHDPLREVREERQRPERRQAQRLRFVARPVPRGGRRDEVATAAPPSSPRSSERWTTRSRKPCSNRNSERWKPGGSSWAIVPDGDAGAGEADERVRLRDVDVAERGERGEDAAGRRVRSGR